MFHADKVRGMQNESISWGWTLPVSTIMYVYCAEITFQCVPGTSRRTEAYHLHYSKNVMHGLNYLCDS